MGGISRRGFLKGSAMAAAGVAGAAALSGCSGSGSTSWEPRWEYETDVLVIGYGGAGMWAACTAHDEGAEVLVLEKAPYRGGGSSSMNCGQWTYPQDAKGAADFAYEAFHGYTPREVVEAWAEEAVQNGDYADKYGFEWELFNNGKPRAEYTIFDGYDQMIVADVKGNGPAFFETMDQNIKDRGIEVIFGCHEEELIQHPETGEVVGCYTKIGDDDDTMHAVKARKGVIMTMGGFEFNEELKAKYLKCYPMRGFYGWKFNEGDGIRMAQKVGADLRSMGLVMGGWNAWFNDPDIVPGGVSVSAPADSYIWVDSLGKRWRDDSEFIPHGGWKIFTHFNESVCNYDRIPSWAIFDQNCFDAGPWGDMVGGLGPDNGGIDVGYMSSNLPADLGGWPGWSSDNKWELERGWIKQGDTLEDLVKVMNAYDDNAPDMTAADLQATIDRWNDMCDTGVDEDFHRGEGSSTGPGGAIGLGKIQGPPYYAIPIYPGLGNTQGGPARNEKGEIIDVDKKPIGRLYGAGSFCNMASHTYAITGGNNGENWVWGRIVGRNAAGLEGWDQQK